jgi:hypothetical protein
LNIRALHFTVFLGFVSTSLCAQTPGDTTKLPFAIADEKKLDPEDLEHKKEGPM